MAKPILVAAGDAASSHNHNIRPRRGPRPRQTTCGASPSSTLLSILAAIVGSSPIYARPAPLPFLCPSLAPKPKSSKTTTKGTRTLSRRSSPLPRSTSRSLPYKFEQGEDGVWRKAGSYTLYGSTVCSESCRETNGAVTTDPLDSTTGLSGSVAAPDTLDDFNLSLPPGWYTSNDKAENRTTLILALSLVLAFFICFFMIGCLFWRKNMRRKHKSADLEMKTRKKKRPLSNTAPHSRTLLIEKEAKTQQKLWVKATARWKANARYTARQRRGKRPASVRSQALESTSTLETTMDHPHPHQRNTDADATLDSSSPPLSRQGSSSSFHPSPFHSQDTPSDERQQTIPIPTLTGGSLNDTHIPTSPPAYRRRTLVTPITSVSEHLSIPNQVQVCSALGSSSKTSFGGSSEAKTPSHFPLEATTSSHVHAAHVATDDKALLARLAELAERPPNENGETPHQISAPEWEDEHPEDFAKTPNGVECDTLDSTLPSIFPPPPSKGKMVGPPFYEYPYTFEEFSDSINPEMGPSAPPFEAPGAPISDDMVMVPSAPPLLNEDDYPETYSETRPQPMEHSGTQEHNGSAADPSSTQRPISQGTLPGYHP